MDGVCKQQASGISQLLGCASWDFIQYDQYESQ